MSALLSPYIVEENPPIRYSMIWLHGLGATGSDFVPMVKELRLPSELGIRFVFPNAPAIPVTFNGGYIMPAWFDIVSLVDESKMDVKGLKQTTLAINQLIEQEINTGIQPQHIMLGGFSQGAVTALAIALNHSLPLGGVLALSGFLPRSLIQTPVSSDFPIFLGHGMHDNVVPYALGKMTYVELTRAGFNPKWHSYPIAHTVSEPELNDISQWVQAIWRKQES